jgi:hypothetical protein
MADEIVWTYADQVTLEGTGLSLAVDGFQAADLSELTWRSDIHKDYPWADFVLRVDFQAAVDGNSFVNLYRQDVEIDSDNDAPAPAATYTYKFVGSFPIESGKGGQSSPQYYPLTDIPIKYAQQFWIENKASQAIDQFWSLKATPKTYMPALK